MVITP